MNYFLNTLLATLNRPSNLGLFLLAALLFLPVTILDYFELIPGNITFILTIALAVLSFYLEAGIYARAWKNLRGETTSIFPEARRYFKDVLVLAIIITIIVGIVGTFFFLGYKMLLFPEVPHEQFSTRLDATLARTIPTICATFFFVYAIPALYARDLPATVALSQSWKFLLNHKNESKILALCVLISLVIQVTLTQLAIHVDTASATYWIISTTNSVVVYTINFVVFLTAAQIFNDLAPQKQDEPPESPLKPTETF